MKRDTDKTKELFLESYERTFTNISNACKSVDISRQCYYDWRKTDDDFDKDCKHIEESVKDFCEGMLLKNIREGATAELIFFLKTKAKDRGYVERQELAGVEDKPIIWQETKTYTEEQIEKFTDGD
tara:strand:+ start:147 stop:524 length:378 start_codon:yes stop_codon:yes gene_type:complete